MDNKIVGKLMYRYYVTLEQLGNSDIPDENLKVVNLAGNKNSKAYHFFFNPPKDGPWMNNFIRIVGMAKKISDYPERWDKDFEGLVDITNGLQKIVKGEIEGLYDEENKSSEFGSIASLIKEPEMEMTQRGIANVGNKMKEEMGFKLFGFTYVIFENVVPKDPKAYGLGFNMPSNAIRMKTWKQ